MPELNYNLTLCPLQSRLQHIYHGIGQPYAKVDLTPMPESTLPHARADFIPQSGTLDLVFDTGLSKRACMNVVGRLPFFQFMWKFTE